MQEEHKAEVEKVLGELGVLSKPRIEVLNKIDLLPEIERACLLESLPASGSVAVSARSGWGIEKLLERVDTALVADPNVSMHESKAFACQVSPGRLDGRAPTPTKPLAPWPTHEPIPDTPAAAQIASTVETDSEQAGKLKDTIEPAWQPIEGTIKANDPDAYITFEDNFAALGDAIDGGDATQAQQAADAIATAADAYVGQYPG